MSFPLLSTSTLLQAWDTVSEAYRTLVTLPRNPHADIAISGLAFSCIGAIAVSLRAGCVKPSHFLLMGGLYYFCRENQDLLLETTYNLQERLTEVAEILHDRTSLVRELARSNQQRERLEVLLTEVKGLMEIVSHSAPSEVRESLQQIQTILTHSDAHLIRQSNQIIELKKFLSDLKETDLEKMKILLDIQKKVGELYEAQVKKKAI